MDFAAERSRKALQPCDLIYVERSFECSSSSRPMRSSSFPLHLQRIDGRRNCNELNKSLTKN